LSKLKGFFVSATNLVKYAEQLDLGRHLHLGKGEEKDWRPSKQALLVDALRPSSVRCTSTADWMGQPGLINRFMGFQFAEIGGTTAQFSDFKTALQELYRVAPSACAITGSSMRQDLRTRNYSPLKSSTTALSLLEAWA
jgi:dsRNA-specific ribonuclease